MSAPTVQKEAVALASDAVRACAHVADAYAQGRPPRLTGGEQAKSPNVTCAEQASQIEYFSHFITDGKGRLIEVPQRKGKQDGVFIDWISFTFHEDTLLQYSKCPLVSDNEYMYVLSAELKRIFGFGITHKCKSKGNKFYEMMFRLGSDEADYGEVHYGGQRDTVLIELKGLGCNLAEKGWESRLCEFLKSALRPRITRVDLALDFFSGEYSPDQALLDHDNGFFDNHNMRPKSEMYGTAWRKEDGSGKTFYIGKKKNSRFVRVYEKGRQLGDKDSKWCRFEIQFNHGDIEIPLDILLDEGGYFSGAFPICSTFENMSQEKRIAVREKTLNLSFEHKIKHAKNAVGRLINFMVDVGLDDKKIVEMLKSDDDGKYPKGLEPERFDLEELLNHKQDVYLHNSPQADLAREMDEYLSFVTSSEFKGNERLFPSETKLNKQDEEYEVWLSRQNMKMSSEAKQLEHAEFEHQEMIARIKWQNMKYKYSLASFNNYRKKPF